MDLIGIVTSLPFPQLLRLRCNKFVGSASGQPPAQQTRCAHLGGAGCPKIAHSVFLRFPLSESPASSLRGEAKASRGVALRVPPGSLLELQGWDQPREVWRAEITVLSLPQPAFLLERRATPISLRAEGHAWFYSQAKEKKEAILFT